MCAASQQGFFFTEMPLRYVADDGTRSVKTLAANTLGIAAVMLLNQYCATLCTWPRSVHVKKWRANKPYKHNLPRNMCNEQF